MRIDRLRAVLLALAPLAVAWNGHGPAEVTWAPERQAPGVVLKTDAVGVVREDGLEAVLVLPVPDLSGDGVLTVQVDRTALNGGGVGLPDVQVRLRLREYADDGTALFRGLTVEQGALHAEGPANGPIRVNLEAVLRDGLQTRKIAGFFSIAPYEAVRDEYVDEDTGEEAVLYHPNTGCWGTWDDTDDDPDSVDWEDDDTSGCEGDDLDDDGPSGSGGCEGDSSESYEADSPDESGCEGDNVDSDTSADSGCDCEGDTVDAAAVGSCARSGPRGPGNGWGARVVRWLPWLMLFAWLWGLRYHARRLRGRRAPVLQGA